MIARDDRDKLTLVTGFWPPKNEVIRRSDVYVRLFEELVRHVDGTLPIVACVDPRVEVQTRAAVERSGVASSRVIVRPTPFDSLHFAQDTERFTDLQPATNAFVHQSAIDYAIVMWSKPATVHAIATENPFRSNHFGWIDFGIPHVSELRDVDWFEVSAESTSTDKVRICERLATPRNEAEDPYFFYCTNSARTCGGFFTGTKDSLAELVDVFDVEVARMIETGTYCVDEQIIAAATALYPDLFECWYADYFGLLRNVRYIERDVDIVLGNLQHCRNEELWPNGTRIAKKLLTSAVNRRLRLEPEECLHLLDDGLACAIHDDRDLADTLAKTIMSLFHYSRLGRGMMKGLWRRSIQESLRPLDLNFSQKSPWSWEEFTSRPELRAWLSCF